jgi:hypothetical protein
MQRLTIRAAGAALLIILALSTTSAALAASGAAGIAAPVTAAAQQADEDEHDVVPVAVWTTAGVLAGAVIFAALYMFKRRIGGFPKNPTWTAPISIMRSETFPAEGDFGDAPADAHGSHH